MRSALRKNMLLRCHCRICRACGLFFEQGRLAYQISDPQMNRYVLGTGRNAVLCGAAANVFVDAVSGTVLENRFVTE